MDPQSIRNVALIGHRGTGKTALAQAMVERATGRRGCIPDPSEVESGRGMTLGMGVAHFEWKGRHVNVLDTPGDGGFIGDAFVAQRAADCAVLVVDARDPVQVVTERVWRRGEREKIPHVIVVNHLDRERADFFEALRTLRERFGEAVIPLNLPIGSGDEFRGIYGLLRGLSFTDGEEREEVPPELEDEAVSARTQLFEAIAESDDTLLEKYLNDEELSFEEVFEGLRRAVAEGVIIPTLAASAEKGIGIERLLNVISESAPSPADRARWLSTDGEEVPPDPEGQFSAYIFKTYVDPHAGRTSVARIVSGRCRADETLVNPRTGSQERLANMAHLCGSEREPVEEAVAGDIVAVSKLRDTSTFDTLCRAEAPVSYEAVELPEPTSSLAIAPAQRGEEEKAFEALRRVMAEDPSLRLQRDEQTGEDVIRGLSQLHLEVALERARSRYGVDVQIRAPKVPFKETLSAVARAQGRHKKQSGGRGQFGDCYIEVSPLERGEGFEFVDEIVGGAIPRQYIPAVEQGVLESMSEGTVAGYPVVDVRVRLYDGSFHSVDSSEMAFKVAGSLAFKNAMKEARPVLLEPFVRLEVLAPAELVGDIMSDLSGRRGRPVGIDQRDDGRQVVRAEVPQVEMLDYARDLRALSGGRANFHEEFAYYEEVPQALLEKVLSANGDTVRETAGSTP